MGTGSRDRIDGEDLGREQCWIAGGSQVELVCESSVNMSQLRVFSILTAARFQGEADRTCPQEWLRDLPVERTTSLSDKDGFRSTTLSHQHASDVARTQEDRFAGSK